MQLAEGVVVAGRFRLRRELGRGGMGAVWLADHVALDVPCAVKFILGEAAQEAEAVARFQREARAAAQIKSPHVVQTLDYGTWEGTPYIAMEYLEGEDLSRRLERKGRLEPSEVFTIVSQVARALQKAHDLGIVHRDLKPENVFLARDAEGAIAKILDFGIAKRTKKLGDSSTKTGALLGTPFYMSPEQTRGTKAVDHRSDLWSLAVIVYECLTGALPFQSEAFGDLLVQIMFNEAVLPTARIPDLPPGIDEWWRKAAAKDPEQRFASARELVDGLRRALAVEDAAALSAVAVNVPLPSEHPPASPDDGTGPASPAATGPTWRSESAVAGTLSARTPSPTSRTFATSPTRRGRGALVVAVAGLAAVVAVAAFVASRPDASPSSPSSEASSIATARPEAPGAPSGLAGAAPSAASSPEPPPAASAQTARRTDEVSVAPQVPAAVDTVAVTPVSPARPAAPKAPTVPRPVAAPPVAPRPAVPKTPELATPAAAPKPAVTPKASVAPKPAEAPKPAKKDFGI